MVATLEYKHAEPLEAESYASPLCCTYSETHVSVQVHTPEPSEAHKNQYVFCGNNPVMFVDPFGLWWWTEKAKRKTYEKKYVDIMTKSYVLFVIPYTPPSKIHDLIKLHDKYKDLKDVSDEIADAVRMLRKQNFDEWLDFTEKTLGRTPTHAGFAEVLKAIRPQQQKSCDDEDSGTSTDWLRPLDEVR